MDNKLLLDRSTWRKKFNKINWVLFGIIFLIEVAIFFLMKQSNKIYETIPEYLNLYLIRPTVCNFAIILIGHLACYYSKNELIRNGAPVVALTLMSAMVSHIHCVFFVTMMIFCVPIFMTSFFGSKRLVNIITLISVISLGCLPFYCKVRSPSTYGNEYFLMSVGIAIIVMLCSRRIALYLIRISNEKNEQLLKRTEEAIAANESKSKFLSIASHEIRTPMNAVVGMTELLLEEDLTDTQRMYLSSIKTSGESLVMIVNDILDESKIEAGKMEIVEDVYRPVKVLEDIRLIIENRIGDKNIKLIYDFDEKLPEFLYGDALRIRQVLINLMNNSVKYTNEGSVTLSITVLESKEDKVKLQYSVKDTGLGIKPEDLNRLFSAFAQVDEKKNHNKEGTGLGLNIAKNFVNLMGGKIEVRSTYGEGSEFFFAIEQRVPCDSEVPDEIRNISVSTNKTVAVTKVVEEEKDKEYRAKVLCVDDTPLNYRVLSGLLAKMNIFTDKAYSGEEAIEKVKTSRYDIIFMDYMMPNMDGAEASRIIRKMPEDNSDLDYTKAVPIIAMSGDTSEETRKIFEESGISDYAEKPISKDVLSKIINKWLT